MSWKVGQEAVFIYAENPYYKTLIGQHVIITLIGQIKAYDWRHKKDVTVDCLVRFLDRKECLDGKDSLGCFFFQLAPLVPDTDFKDEEVEDEITVEAA